MHARREYNIGSVHESPVFSLNSRRRRWLSTLVSVAPIEVGSPFLRANDLFSYPPRASIFVSPTYVLPACCLLPALSLVPALCRVHGVCVRRCRPIWWRCLPTS